MNMMYSRFPLIRYIRDLSDAELPEILYEWVIFSVIAKRTSVLYEFVFKTNCYQCQT